MGIIKQGVNILRSEGIRSFIRESISYAVQNSKQLITNLAYSGADYDKQIMAGAVDRPYYGYCIYVAAQLADILGYEKFSVLEFGVGDGAGLKNIEKHIQEIEKEFDVEIEVYGFDTGEGPPAPQSYKDMPYAYDYSWSADTYDEYAISEWNSRSELVLGDIQDTKATFFKEYDPAPIGCAFFDMNLYSSTKHCLDMFGMESENYLPRIICQFDTVVSNEVLRAFNNEYVGESAAINEFNDENEDRKLAKVKFKNPWQVEPIEPNEIYQFHLFNHTDYDAPIRTPSDSRFENVNPGTNRI